MVDLLFRGQRLPTPTSLSQYGAEIAAVMIDPPADMTETPDLRRERPWTRYPTS
jgi:hypothetical protein